METSFPFPLPLADPSLRAVLISYRLQCSLGSVTWIRLAKAQSWLCWLYATQILACQKYPAALWCCFKQPQWIFSLMLHPWPVIFILLSLFYLLGSAGQFWGSPSKPFTKPCCLLSIVLWGWGICWSSPESVACEAAPKRPPGGLQSHPMRPYKWPLAPCAQQRSKMATAIGSLM